MGERDAQVLLVAETEPRQLRRSLEQIAGSAERASHLINQLLSLARAESSSEKIYAVEQLDLNDLATDVVQDLFPRALVKRIDLGLEAAQEALIIDGNPVLLRELMKNLVDNAIKYTPAGGQVTVRTIGTEFAILEVEDSGIGIPESDRGHISLPILPSRSRVHRSKAPGCFLLVFPASAFRPGFPPAIPVWWLPNNQNGLRPYWDFHALPGSGQYIFAFGSRDSLLLAGFQFQPLILCILASLPRRLRLLLPVEYPPHI